MVNNMESKYKSFDELPLMLSVVQVAEVFGISKTSAYELSHTKSFPSMSVGGRIIYLEINLLNGLICRLRNNYLDIHCVLW